MSFKAHLFSHYLLYFTGKSFSFLLFKQLCSDIMILGWVNNEIVNTMIFLNLFESK